jgi:site-specific DNA-methyltransferase (cytosine-N4-specific)
MSEFYADDWLTIHGGDARDVLPTLPAESVDCIVTSPPYWGLRDYGTATWVGGDTACNHLNTNWDRSLLDDGGRRDRITPMRATCTHCGASRVDSQLGLEATPEQYVANLVAVFRELRRVLKPTGTAWLNLGDSYNGVGRGEKANGLQVAARITTQTTVSGLKPKDLVGIPWRVAFALQADGWWLRSDIIWSKPNPMPESVTDRPTKAHEYLFLLTKSARYYFDQEAVREATSPNWRYNGGAPMPELGEHRLTDGARGHQAQRTYEVAKGANLRSVWTIATRPYPGAHFAVFPPELPERCIKAGCPQDGVVLDPFAGSGTVGLVANRLSRRAILIDLNPAYLEQQMKRNAQVPVGL